MGLFSKIMKSKDKKIKKNYNQEKLEIETNEKNSDNVSDVLPNLVFNDFLYEGEMEFSIFKKGNMIKLELYIEDETEPKLTVEHEQTYKYIIENEEKIISKIISELKNNYQIELDEQIEMKFKPVSIIIFGNGNSGIQFDDLDEPRGISNKNIVIEITPEISYFGSIEDYA